MDACFGPVMFAESFVIGEYVDAFDLWFRLATVRTCPLSVAIQLHHLSAKAEAYVVS